MLQYLRALMLNRWVRQIGEQLESRYRSDPDFVEFTFGGLTLSSFRPERKLAGRFGEYSYSTWEGTAIFPFWRSELNVSLVIPASRPQPQHLDALREALQYPIAIRHEIEKAIFSYYCSTVYREGARDVDGRLLPKPAAPKRLRRLLGTPTLYLDYFGTRRERGTCDLFFSTCWDDEHELKVRLQDWRVIAVGK